MDTGAKARLDILKNDANRNIIEPFTNHNWVCKIDDKLENDQYLIIELKKASAIFKIGFLYSSATSNDIYKSLDLSVNLIVINGNFYNLQSYAYGIETEIIEKSNIGLYIIKWNETVSDGKISLGSPPKPKLKPKEFTNHIQSETPIKQIWSRIKQFKTKGLAKKLIIERYKKEQIEYTDEILNEKAAGFSFCIQNGCDYFEDANKQKLNQRIVSLYYGGIAFASAEMIASPRGPSTLEEIENMTKYGHGLYTLDSTDNNSFEGFVVGVLRNGFFKNWQEFLGIDCSGFPSAKIKNNKDVDFSKDEITTIIDLFSRIPELEDLFMLVTDAPTNWLNIDNISDMNMDYLSDMNMDYLSAMDGEMNIDIFNNDKKTESQSYVSIRDISSLKTINDIESLDLPFHQIEYHSSEDTGLHFKALLKHTKKHWHEEIDLHYSPFARNSYIIPTFGKVNQHKSICISLLYALSILARYRPSIWREIVSGKHENYLVLIEEFLDVYERVSPQYFLESFLNKKISVAQPGSLFGYC